MKDPPSTLQSLELDAKRSSGAGHHIVRILRRTGVAIIDLAPGQVLQVGRRFDNDIVIEHAAASRYHALIRGGEPPEIEDVGSTTGTRVMGNPIPPRTRIPLVAGSVVAIADTVLHIGPAGIEASSEALPVSAPASRVVLRDPRMREVYSLAERVAATPLSVLILGETGVGKELVAEHIHASSPRREGPFLRVNCAALADGILASELFGHERGAFTGAHSARDGLFEAADGGTVLLDEIGELAPETQAKLLRVLESGEVTRVGSHQPRKVDVRIVSATNRDLSARIAAGAFRSDLFFRLNGVSIALPPLRERPDDIIALAELFIDQNAAATGKPAPVLSEKARQLLLRHPWPGNVRELKNAVERAVLLTRTSLIESTSLQLDTAEMPQGPPDVPPESTPAAAHRRAETHDHAGTDPTPSMRRRRTQNRADDLRAELVRAEREHILEALRQAGNQAGAAKLLGMSRRALIYRLDALGIPRPRKGAPPS